ncbi:MAG: translocation/assembly module TamB domain-containing protein [Bernardetiaceae bacterium]|nr:translocation/assembly module TamB domain-containing protein [Bernardetiaceae bacterium]
MSLSLRIKRIAKKAVRILLWCISIIVGLFLLLFGLFLLPPVQDFAAGQAEAYLKKKLQTEVRIDKFRLSFPKAVSLEGVYLEDAQQDTLLFSQSLHLDVSMFSLLNSHLKINSIRLDSLTANLWVAEDSTSNIDFILEAFGLNDDKTVEDKESGSSFKISVAKIDLHHIALRYDDRYQGDNFNVKIGHFHTHFKDFDLQKMHFNLDAIALNDSEIHILQKQGVAESSSVGTQTTTAGETQTKAGDEGFGVSIALGTAHIQNLRTSYQNDVNGQKAQAHIGDFKLKGKDIDLDAQKLLFESVSLKNSYVAYSQEFSEKIQQQIAVETAAKEGSPNQNTNEDTSESKPWHIAVSQIDIAQNEIKMNDYNYPKLKRGLDMNHMHFKNLTLQAKDFVFSPENTSLELLNIVAKDATQDFEITNARGKISLDNKEIKVKDFQINTGRSQIKQDIDIAASLEQLIEDWENAPIQINTNGTSIAFADLFYLSPETAQFFNMPLSNPYMLHISGQANGSVNNLTLRKFRIRGLRQTDVVLDGRVSGAPDTDKMKFDLELQRFKSSRQDLLMVLPKGSLPEGYDLPEQITANASLKGSMQDLFFEFFTEIDRNRLRISGNLKNADKPDKIYANVATQELLLYTEDIKKYLPDTLLSDFALPPYFKGDVEFKGTSNNFITRIAMGSAWGGFDISSTMAGLSDKPQYTAKIELDALNIGRFLQDTMTYGDVSVHLDAEGVGFDAQNLDAKIAGQILHFEYMRYLYEDIDLDVTAKGTQFTAQIHSDDENADLTLDGFIDIDSTVQQLRSNLKVRQLNFKNLNLSEDSLTVALDLNANLVGFNLDKFKGKASLRNLRGIYRDKNLHIDSLVLSSLSEKGATDMTLRSDFMEADLRGNIDFSSFDVALKEHVNTYIFLDSLSASEKQRMADNEEDIAFDFELHLRKSDIIRSFLPALKRLDPADFVGEYRAADKHFAFSGAFPYIDYSGVIIDSLKVDIESDPEAFYYRVGMDSVRVGSFMLAEPYLNGKLENDVADINLSIFDKKGKRNFDIKTQLQRIDSSRLEFRLAREQMLNYEIWTAPRDNQVIISDVIGARDFVLNKGVEQIFLRSENNDKDLRFGFADFDIGNITRAFNVDGDSLLLADGILHGYVLAQNFQETFGLQADISLRKLKVLGISLGELSFKVQSLGKDLKKYYLNLYLQSSDNDIRIAGAYDANEGVKDPIDMTLEVREFEAATYQKFADEYVKDLKGRMKGRISIKGNADKPRLSGSLDFDSLRFLPLALGSRLKLKNERITFDEQGIFFDKFTFSDAAGNPFRINGRILTQNYRDYLFKLNLTAQNFVFVDSDKRSGNDMYYGKAIANLDVKVRGDLSSPVVTAQIKVLEGTNLTYLLPADDVTKIEKEGVIEFVDMHAPIDSTLLVIEKDSSAYPKGLDVQASLAIDRKAKMNVVIDPSNVLEVQGGGDLNLNLKPNGEMNITGRYEIEDGIYKLNFYGIAERNFKLRKGSYLRFFGDVMDIEADLTAAYRIDTAPYELMKNQPGSEQELNKYKQRLPFNVLMKMKGEILNPSISFDIELAEPERAAMAATVDTRLQTLRRQESELNKQVFALLILGGFISENPLDSGPQSDMGFAERTARNTVSDLLSSQLNQLAGRHIKGVDLNFDLRSEEDFTAGEGQNRTQLDVNVSKSFFDDRLTFQIGSKIDLEGPQAQQQQQQGLSGFAGDMIVSFLITKDGRYKMQVFRENNFAGIIDGLLIETGLSLLFTREYDHISELFRKDKNDDKE